MSGRFEYVTFDCYGTLIDWEGGISGAFLAAAERTGAGLERGAILEAYADIEPLIQQGPFRPYRDVLRETAQRVADRLGWTPPPDDPDFLSESLGGWMPFADTNPALVRLARAGYALGILSNVDDALLEATRRHLDVDFELVITAEGVSSYKPAPAHFLAARERIGDAGWLHAAQSLMHDVAPAVELEIPVAWINRNDEPLPREPRPNATFPSLTELADWLTD